MDIIKNPEIDKLDKDSLKYRMYVRLYQDFFNAQIKKSPSNPNGIEEGDVTSIHLHNSAYSFANTMADGIDIGSGGNEIDVSELIQKKGDSMRGHLNANWGFSAGDNGTPVLSTFMREDGTIGVNIDNILSVDGSFVLNGKDVLSRDSKSNTTVLKDTKVSIVGDTVTLPNNTHIGGVVFDKDSISFPDGEFYSSKNSNKADVDWAASNLTVDKDATVGGNIKSQTLQTSGDFMLSDAIMFRKGSGVINVLKPLDVKGGVTLNGKRFVELKDNSLSIGYSDILYIGTSFTKEVRIAKPIKSWNGSMDIISETGFGRLNGVVVTHNNSSPLIKTDDGGVIFDGNIWLNKSKDVYLQSVGKKLDIVGIGGGLAISSVKSDNPYAPLNKDSKSILLHTEDDYIKTDKPIHSEGGFISGLTFISDKQIRLSRTNLIESVDDYLLIHGDTRFKHNIQSEKYSSGYTGSGWGIYKDAVTGVASMSLDELTVRKKMRLYELEVNKITGTNGSIWVSSSMRADNVKQII